MLVPRERGPERLLLLEVGSSRLRALAVVADDRQGSRVCGAASVRTRAGRDALWNEPASAREEIAALLDEVERQAGSALRPVLVSLGGTHMALLRSQGRLAMKLPLALRTDHLEQALEAASHLGLPPDREVLHVLPTSYLADGARLRRPPLGLRARGLIAECVIVTVSRAALDGIESVLGSLDRTVMDAAAEPLLTARAVLRQEERLQGTVLVDLGAERACATVHRDGVLQAMACIGAGAAHVTRDLAYALQVQEGVAEELKQRRGVAWGEAGADAGASPSGPSRYGESFTAVIEPRMRELFQLLRDGLQQSGTLAPSDRVILTGGGAQLRATADLAHAVFGLPVRHAAVPESADAAWNVHRSQTMRGLLAYAASRGFPSRAPRWSSAVRRLRGALVQGGHRQASLADATWNDGVEVARHGERGTARVGVDSEVHDVRVRTGV